MKIAVSGKGGVGKSTIAAAIALTMAKRGQKVLALDSDPDANFASALGIPKSVEIKPISTEIKLIEERTGVQVNEYGKVFKLNPEVSDIAEKFLNNMSKRNAEQIIEHILNQGSYNIEAILTAQTKILIKIAELEQSSK